MLNPTIGLAIWTAGIALALVLLGFVLRAILRIGRRPQITAEDATIAALQLRVEMLESDMHAVDSGLEHLKARTEFAERLTDRQDSSGGMSGQGDK